MVVQRAEGKRVVIDYGKLRTTDGGWIDGRPDEEELRKKVDAQLAAALAAFEQSVDRSTRVAMSTKGLKDPADEMSAGGTSRGGTNSATDDTLKAELRVRDKEQGLVLLAAGADRATGVHAGEEADGDKRGAARRSGEGQDEHVRVGEAVDGDEDAEGRDEQGAVVDMLRGRGRARWQPPMPELLQVETAGYIVERARRRVSNRAGRYVREHQVEYSTGPERPEGRRWLTEAAFEQLEDAAKVEDDLGTGDGV
ncbi:hypothetical protein PHYSODRAFT_288758 [Phytophthora sojae]|uniref:Uncharacterized protein n=1 Tax=Phytophthora sojae (strain P6497) TaxID=1094619 RepID=G5A7L5_PHYSP|nr:hypothetical protein PHYSODRAFT_288758 [Phytophthora sojae]EGZ07891.1 hypothetical protein PHYSODRAFT_288758 [Phytophthora sojae]|eukprot:XP_009536063.1 hypothetical protein PHYSODRAFT_288758 [Phytophthora sojae]